jgi:hypothetical protein
MHRLCTKKRESSQRPSAYLSVSAFLTANKKARDEAWARWKKILSSV